MIAKASHAVGRSVPVILLLLASVTAGSAETLAPRDIRQNLFDTCFVSANEGWVVGDLGRVFKTTDGGATWLRQEPAGRDPMLGIACIDGKQAWLSSIAGRIYKTTDGGATWQLQQTPAKRNLFKVAFPTPQRGTAVGDFGTIVHTEDGGTTWKEINLPDDFKLPDSALDSGVLPNDALLYGLSYVDAEHGWISGEFGTILATSDGGTTWKQQKTGLETTIFGIDFLDAKTGTAVGIDSVILRTEDGGETWNPIKSPFTERSYYEIALSPTHSWIVGGQGTILTSADGGKTWTEFKTPIQLASEWFRGASMVGENAYLVGGAGLIYRTEGGDAKLLRAASAAPASSSHGGAKS
ncbi:hypothetical protein K2Z84_21640 [Candidatus Binatia bacterium]|jgi:photosystem II stability/assembly factor-like uncharacterized protein|nr:hypothetical protein [Candidatus Binatia bacterium]